MIDKFGLRFAPLAKLLRRNQPSVCSRAVKLLADRKGLTILNDWDDMEMFRLEEAVLEFTNKEGEVMDWQTKFKLEVHNNVSNAGRKEYWF